MNLVNSSKEIYPELSVSNLKRLSLLKYLSLIQLPSIGWALGPFLRPE